MSPTVYTVAEGAFFAAPVDIGVVTFADAVVTETADGVVELRMSTALRDNRICP